MSELPICSKICEHLCQSVAKFALWRACFGMIRHHAVAPGFFRLIQRVIGGIHGVLNRRMLGKRRHAERACHAQHFPFIRLFKGFDSGAKLLGAMLYRL